MSSLSKSPVVGVIGAGTLGAGIAQVAAAAGHRVRLFDTSMGAAAEGKDRVARGWNPSLNADACRDKRPPYSSGASRWLALWRRSVMLRW
jgi:3-hydroxyacyl-CoA dehydrogenase